MSRRLRFIPDGGALVEVTCRTLQGRFLLRPTRPLNEIVLGVLGRAQKRHPVRICAFTFASTHFHLLLDVDDAHQLSGFMGYLRSNLAREVGRLTGWREKVWSRRYQAIIVSSEETAQIDRPWWTAKKTAVALTGLLNAGLESRVLGLTPPGSTLPALWASRTSTKTALQVKDGVG